MPDVRLPSGWKQTNLAGLADYINGFAFNESYWSAEGLPIVRIAQITGSQGIVDRYKGSLPDTYRLGDGDLIFSWSGTLAVVRWNGGPAWLNQHLFKVVPGNGVDRDLLFHLLQASVAEMDKRAHGSTMKHIKRGELREFGVTLPVDAAEQRALASVLDTLDTTIRHTEAIIEKLKQVKQGLLHDLLTRGIDANGELRPPQSQAPQLYKGSPLGWIPKEWEALPTMTCCTLITKGTTPASGDMWQGSDGVRFLRVDNLSFDGQFDFEASKFRISAATHRTTLGRSMCLPGDVLTNIVGPPLGKLGLVTDRSGDININQAIALFRPKDDLLPRFLLLWLGSGIAQSWLRQRAKQTSGQVNLTLALCQELPLAFMDLAEQKGIISRVAAAQDRIDLESRELAKRVELKSGLMDDLLTGRVRVTPLLDAAAPA